MAFEFVKTGIALLLAFGLSSVIAQAYVKWEIRRRSSEGFPLSRNYMTGTEGKR